MFNSKNKFSDIKKIWKDPLAVLGVHDIKGKGRSYIIIPVVTAKLPQTHQGRVNFVGGTNDFKEADTNITELDCR